MSEERCTQHDMIVAFCADCRGLRGEEEGAAEDPLAGLLVERFLTAQYHGRCVIDNEAIAPGDEIAMLVRDIAGGPPYERVGYGCTECVNRVVRPR